MQLCAFCYAFVAFVAILFNSHSLSVVSLTLNIINAICSFCSLCTSAQKYSISKFMEQNEKSWPRKSNTFVCKSSVCKMVCFSIEVQMISFEPASFLHTYEIASKIQCLDPLASHPCKLPKAREFNISKQFMSFYMIAREKQRPNKPNEWNKVNACARALLLCPYSMANLFINLFANVLRLDKHAPNA